MNGRTSRELPSYFLGNPSPVRVSRILSKTAGSSFIAGTVYGTLPAILLIVPGRIFPDRVLGNRFSAAACQN
jgi:hypothetical protein